MFTIKRNQRKKNWKAPQTIKYATALRSKETIIFWIDKLVYWFFCYLIVIILYFIFNKRVPQHGDIKNHYVSLLTVGSAEKLKIKKWYGVFLNWNQT